VKRELPRRDRPLNIVLFSGGRGSGALSKELVRRPDVSLTIAINGYDDGLSTGEVRRFLGDALGPSDFRKNASRVARELRSCTPGLIDLLDLRFPQGCTAEAALRTFCLVRGDGVSPVETFETRLAAIAGSLGTQTRTEVAASLDRFEAEWAGHGRRFDFSDCSLGNLVFTGAFLSCGRRFNTAVDSYCALLGLPPGLVDNVSDGTNAFLVALDRDDRLLGSEGEIVDAKRRNRIKDIYLIDHPLRAADREALSRLPLADVVRALASNALRPALNPRVKERIGRADVIIYAPGTQHSSLFPSYLTVGLSEAIAANLRALKLLITNIQTDAEIVGSTAVDIIRRAVFYLEEKGSLHIPTPCLITHYLINDPGRPDPAAAYVPLGKLDSLEDPRLVRVGHYEEGVTGRHDAVKVVGPFVEAQLSRGARRRVAVWLYDGSSADKVTQTLLELVRAGVADLPIDIAVLVACGEPLDGALLARLPFPVVQLPAAGAASARQRLRTEAHDYVVLFESSGMYMGEDLIELLLHVPPGRLDAIWGSRRLSVRDIAESIRLRYRHRPLLRLVSQAGSYALSLAYLLLYGRYVSDTLSGARAVRTAYALAADVDPQDKLLNQRLLSLMMRDRAEFLEVPVRFFALSPERVRRTTLGEGLRSLAMIAWWRLARRVAPARQD